MDSGEARDVCGAVLDALRGTVIAEDRVLETVLLGVLARGHVLLEDVPGTGKTLTARSMARALGLSFSRVQFTPDLLPADVTGTHVFDQKERTFEFREGPIFANVVLADEINRAPPKTQAALLEAMEERQVTAAGETHGLPDPFFVIATQNPIEAEGSLHPDVPLYLNGELWRARDALEFAKAKGELVYTNEEMRLYSVNASTQSLGPDGRLSQRDAMVYEVAYEGELYAIRTRTGREIRVTANHPFLVYRAGVTQWVEAGELRHDDRIVVPDRLESVDRPFRSHVDALETLEGAHTLVRRETVRAVEARLSAGSALDREDLDASRIARRWSKRDLAERAELSHDRVLSHFRGTDNGIERELRQALAEGGRPDVADYVESRRIHRFDGPPTDSEAGLLVGFILAGGHWDDGSVTIYRSDRPALFDRWVRITRDLGCRVRIRSMEEGHEANVESTPFVDYLKARYHLDAPNRLIAAPASFRRALLETVLLVESQFDTQRRRITFSQEDPDLTNLISHLLLQFDIRPLIEHRDRVYRITIRGQDIATYVEQFEWPGVAPPVNSSTSSHRTTPVDPEVIETVIEGLWLDPDGEFGDRRWYQSFRRNGGGSWMMYDEHLRAFLKDVEREIDRREGDEIGRQTPRDHGADGQEDGLPAADVRRGAENPVDIDRQSYGDGTAHASTAEVVTDRRKGRLGLVRRHTERLRELVESDVFVDGIRDISSEPYEGTVIGLSVPGTHNYLGGLGACGISHNTFPLPEAQVDRFAVKTSLGYPDHEGEVELLRRRAGRTTRSPTVDPVLDGEADVKDLQAVPETIHVDDDVLDYIVRVARATREDRHVEVGVSPRGTQRLFEAARARATIGGREFVTPDDVKTVAVPVLAHRLVLTPDSVVSDVDRRDIVETVLTHQPVPTVE